MKKVSKVLAGILAAVLMTSLAGCKGKTEEYPTRQVSLIIQAAPGGESDMTGRLIGQTMEKELGVPVVCSNKTGASGAVAFQYVRSQKADGYTIGICPAEIAMVKSLGYSDVVPDDMDFLGGACETPAAIIVKGDAPYNTLQEFIDYCKAHPGEVRSGTAGAGSTLHIASELFAKSAGVKLNHISFDGSSPAITALMGGHVDLVAAGALAASVGVETGDLKVLAILGDERSELFPDVPTAEEAGLDCKYSTWVGLYAPKGLSDDVKAKLEAAVKAGIEADAYTDFAKSKGLVVKYRSAKEFTDFINENYKMYEELIPTLDLKK